MRSLRIAVTGAQGQVARALAERAPAFNTELVALARPLCDLAHPKSVDTAVAGCGADLVVNAAAYTAVDKAENEAALCFQVNRDGAGAVAAAAARACVPLIHLSTDYVFDGYADRPYCEDDPANPQCVYGASKWAGEQAVVAAHPGAVIARTAWVHSPFGQNFVRTMLRLGAHSGEVRVVADQVGSPTYALDLADALLTMAHRLIHEPTSTQLRGVFHVAGSGGASWADFAEKIFAAAAACGRAPARVARITTADYPTPAKRPKNSRLAVYKLWAAYGIRLPNWSTGAGACVGRVLAHEAA